MIAEATLLLRRFTRPWGRTYWWPGRSKHPQDCAGVLLISLPELDDKTRRRLLKHYRSYHRQPLLDDVRPADPGLDRKDSLLAITYRLILFTARTLRFWKLLTQGRLSWSRHLCECDGIARTHQALALGLPYYHLGELSGKRFQDIRNLQRLISSLDHRRYEVWLIFRNRQEAYVPSSLDWPDVPLTIAEVEELAQTRSSWQPRILGLQKVARPSGVLRLMTYNVHSCLGLDGRLSVRRIAEVLERYDPDVVVLQELDEACKRTGRRRQLDELATLWPAHTYFQAAMSKSEGQYGIGLLSRLPIQKAKGYELPNHGPRHLGLSEPRVAISAVLKLANDSYISILGTHLGLTRADRLAQIEKLETIMQSLPHPIVLMGDLNCSPNSREIKHLTSLLKTACLPPEKTWFGRHPIRVLDYILLQPSLRVVNSFAPTDSLTVVASDHLPLLVDLDLPLHPVDHHPTDTSTT